MKDTDCVQFLQEVLPRLRLRWPGFRKVRRQVCKRVDRRMRALGLSQLAAYREFLDGTPSEWDLLDEMCRISISRYYRDIRVFDLLREDVLPMLARQVAKRGDEVLDCWSAGCASGEEAYTLKLIWEIELQHAHSDLSLHVTATDADDHMLERVKRGCYSSSSVKDCPPGWLDIAFEVSEDEYRLRNGFRHNIELIRQDIRHTQPDGPFDLILCRHLVFTYFEEPLQREIAEQIIARLRPGGFLVTGKQEELPQASEQGMELYRARSGVFRRSLD